MLSQTTEDLCKFWKDFNWRKQKLDQKSPPSTPVLGYTFWCKFFHILDLSKYKTKIHIKIMIL